MDFSASSGNNTGFFFFSKKIEKNRKQPNGVQKKKQTDNRATPLTQGKHFFKFMAPTVFLLFPLSGTQILVYTLYIFVDKLAGERFPLGRVLE